MNDYRTFTSVPAFERAIWEGDKLVNEAAAIKWSGDLNPPAIGAQIVVTMNRLGPATIEGYFVEAGWLGLLCRLHNAPDWHREQRGGDPIAHIFGVEFEARS